MGDRDVPCPYCKVSAGERCQDGQGDHVNWCHAVRVTMANARTPEQLHMQIITLERRVECLETLTQSLLDRICATPKRSEER